MTMILHCFIASWR